MTTIAAAHQIWLSAYVPYNERLDSKFIVDKLTTPKGNTRISRHAFIERLADVLEAALTADRRVMVEEERSYSGMWADSLEQYELSREVRYHIYRNTLGVLIWENWAELWEVLRVRHLLAEKACRAVPDKSPGHRGRVSGDPRYRYAGRDMSATVARQDRDRLSLQARHRRG